MKSWLFYSFLAMFSWGSYIVVAKIATSNEYCGLPPRLSAVLMYCGIGLVFATYWFLTGGQQFSISPKSALAGISSGSLWGLGMVFSLCAIRAGADVARLTPIYNCNTLVAVLLGILVLKEIHGVSDISTVLIGSILIILGGILVVR